MRYPLFIARPMLTGVPDARADVVDIQWSGDGRFKYQGAIAAGKFVEVCGKLPSGLNVRWDFEASTSVDFNVHYHEGKDVVFSVQAVRGGLGQGHPEHEGRAGLLLDVDQQVSRAGNAHGQSPALRAMAVERRALRIER